MIETAIISVLAVLVVIGIFTTINLLKKNEKQEDILIGYIQYLDQISKTIEASDKKLFNKFKTSLMILKLKK